MVVQQAVWASLSIDLTGAVMQRMEDGPPQPAGISANTKDKPIGQTSAAQRLKELNELFKEGLITEKDFESKKQEILKGI